MATKNKQHNARAASFIRIAKGWRVYAKKLKRRDRVFASQIVNALAKEVIAEAKRLRRMR